MMSNTRPLECWALRAEKHQNKMGRLRKVLPAHQKKLANSVAPLQPFILAAFQPWGDSRELVAPFAGTKVAKNSSLQSVYEKKDGERPKCAIGRLLRAFEQDEEVSFPVLKVAFYFIERKPGVLNDFLICFAIEIKKTDTSLLLGVEAFHGFFKPFGGEVRRLFLAVPIAIGQVGSFLVGYSSFFFLNNPKQWFLASV